MKINFMLLFALLFTGTLVSQTSHVQVKNNSHMDLMYGFEILHGSSAGLPGILKDGQTIDFYFNPGILTGSEGYVLVYPLNQQNERVMIYYDNPFIGQAIYSTISSNLLLCKVVKWDIINNGSNCELMVEITNPGSNYGKPVPIVPNNNATIKGSVFWNSNEIQSPELSPFGYAFSCKAVVPVTFTESNGPFTLEKTGTYNGKKGYFEGSQQVGTVTFETVPSANNGLIELKYTITGVPVDLPVEMDITTDYSKSKWIAGPHKPKPGEDYMFIVGTFPNTSNTSVTVTNNVSEMKGVDFSCEGDWLKFDENGNMVGGGNIVNKITGRKTNPVLPGNGMILITKTASQSNQMIQAPGIQNKTQSNQVQKIRTGGVIKIKQ